MNLLAASLALTLAFQGSGFSLVIPNLRPAPKGDTPVAKIDDVIIKASDVEALLWETKAKEIIGTLANYQLVKKEAERLGVFVSDQEVNQGVAEFVKSVATEAPTGTDIDSYLKTMGRTPSINYLMTKTDLLLTKIAKQKFQASRWVKVSMIAVTPLSDTAADTQNASEKIKAAHERLKKGEAWEAVAFDTIVVPEYKKSAGAMGWRNLDEFVPLAKTALLNAKPGGFTEVFTVPNGLHIYRLDMVGSDAKGKDLDEAIASALNRPDRFSLRFEAFQDIIKRAKVENLYDPKPGGQ
jgi:hypothetical protein